MHLPHRPKRNESGRKITLNFGEDLFFFFFGDHLILGEKKFEFPFSAEKSLSILVKTSEFLRFWLQIPPHQNFLDPPLPLTSSHGMRVEVSVKVGEDI